MKVRLLLSTDGILLTLFRSSRRTGAKEQNVCWLVPVIQEITREIKRTYVLYKDIPRYFLIGYWPKNSVSKEIDVASDFVSIPH